MAKESALEAKRASELEAERVKAELVEAERVEAEFVEAERVEEERVEAERVEAARAEAERVEAELVEAERVEAERVEAERIEAERVEEHTVSLKVDKRAHDGAASVSSVTISPPVNDSTLFKHLARAKIISFLGRQPMAYKTSIVLEVNMTKEGATHEKFVTKTVGDSQIELLSRMRSADGEGNLFLQSFYSGSLRKNSWTHIDKSTVIADKYDEMWAAIDAAIDVFLERGSGWVLEDCVRLRILCHKVIAFAQLGSSYLALPSALKNKHACVNVQNTDNDCFAYAVLSALLCDDPRVRASNTRATVYREHMNALIFEKSGDKINMPFDVKDAPKFEAWNSQPISILGVDISDMAQGMQYYRDHLEIEYMSQLPSAKPVIWLIRIYNEDNSHYVWLKKPNALLRMSSAVNPCTRCLRSFKRVTTLTKHKLEKNCLEASTTLKLLPMEDEHYTCFTKKKPPIPFRIYMDGESMLPKSNVQRGTGTQVDSEHVYTHIGLLFVSDYPDLISNEYKTFTGLTCVVDALQWCDAKAGECCTILGREEPLRMTAEDEMNFRDAMQCHICSGILGDYRVRDHDHVKGIYRGAAHNACNLKYTFKKAKRSKKKKCTEVNDDQKSMRTTFRLPVIAHNMKGYDSHFIMQFAGATKLKMGNPIAQTLDKYMTFSIGRCKFIDSMQFLNSSLEKLADNLRTGGEDKFKLFNEGFKGSSDELLSDMRRKGVFPYEWYDSADKLRLQLPSRDAFSSKLCDEECTTEDYERAQRVYREAKCSDFGDYLQQYLKVDVLLLADVFESFRATWYADHTLDPLNYITLPGLSWDSMLKKLKVDSVLLRLKADSGSADDIDAYCAFPNAIECFQVGQLEMLEFVAGSKTEPSMIRGGVSSIMHRFAEANNPYLGTSEQFNAYKADCGHGTVEYKEACKKYGWDPSKPANYIMYWDANNLYGWAMSQYLPIGEYAWVEHLEGKWHRALFNSDGYGSADELTARFTPTYIYSIGNEDSIGYILEVDGYWPDELHDKLNAFPLGPDNVHFEPSPTTARLMESLGVKGDKLPKLTPSLAPKSKYKVHYRALQQMIERGFVLTRVHRVLSFRQYPILKTYIDFNTAKRASAKNDFEKDLYKLANNSIYGKTAENVENHIIVKFARGAKRALYYAGQKRTDAFRIFSNELTAYQQRRSVVMYNRPMIMGAGILDIARTLVYDFHYGHVMKRYPDAKLLFTDTDSLCYQISTSDIYEDMLADRALFDMSDYSPSFTTLSGLSVRDTTNKKAIGKMKDEQAGICNDETCTRCRGPTPLPHAVRAFAGLRSKMYACDLVSSDDTALTKKTAKGVKKGYVEKHLKFNNYKAALFGSGEDLRQHATFSSIRSVNHQVATIEQTKVSLCAIDTKRYVLEDNVHTLAHGHWRIKAMQGFATKVIETLEPVSGEGRVRTTEAKSNQMKICL